MEIEPLASSVLDGYNGCVMAYGPTGSGKTHTMLGPETDPGVSIRFVQRMFEQAEAQGRILSEGHHEALSDRVQFHISMSMIEIYNEEIRDLLLDEDQVGAKLQVRTNRDGQGVSIPNMTNCILENAAEFLSVFQRGDAIRSTSATDIHEHSSRSHSIVILDVLKRVPGGALQSASSTHGKLYLVDLAGSERVRRSGVHPRGRDAFRTRSSDGGRPLRSVRVQGPIPG